MYFIFYFGDAIPSGLPTTTMESVWVKPGEKAVFHCEISSYPKSVVTWSFIPCSNAEFDSESCNYYTNEIIYNVSCASNIINYLLVNAWVNQIRYIWK